LTPSTTGLPWPLPTYLTLSFAPDGTPIAGAPSSLFRLLNAQAPTSTWEGVIGKAVQTWTLNANLNVNVVNDGGQPFGTAGALRQPCQAVFSGIASLAMRRRRSRPDPTPTWERPH